MHWLCGTLCLQTVASLEEQKHKAKKSAESLELSTARCNELQQQCLTAEHELKDRVCSLFFKLDCGLRLVLIIYFVNVSVTVNTSTTVIV